MVHRRHLVAFIPTLAWGCASANALQVHDGHWNHSARQRDVPWRLRLPRGDMPCPLVLYSPGLGRGRDSGEAWGNAWSEAGIAVLHLQHPGSDFEAVRSSGRAARSAANSDQMIERLLDLRFAINETMRLVAKGEAIWNRIQIEAIGMAGHSFGALTVQAAAGQTYPGAGDLADPRPKAFIAFSPSVPLGVKLSPKDSFGGVVRPLFSLTGSLDGNLTQRSQADSQRAAVFDALPPGHRALLWLAGAEHGTFAGNTLVKGSDAIDGEGTPQRHTRLIATTTALWWRWRLLDDDRARRQLLSITGLGPDDRLVID